MAKKRDDINEKYPRLNRYGGGSFMDKLDKYAQYADAALAVSGPATWAAGPLVRAAHAAASLGVDGYQLGRKLYKGEPYDDEVMDIILGVAGMKAAKGLKAARDAANGTELPLQMMHKGSDIVPAISSPAKAGFVNRHDNGGMLDKDLEPKQPEVVTAWEDLPLSQRAEYIRMAVREGLTTLPEVREHYNTFGWGGKKDQGPKLGSRKDRIVAAYTQFINDGYSDAQARGMVAALLSESGLDPNAVGGYNKQTRDKAFGIAQWHGSRRPKDTSFAGQLKHVSETGRAYNGDNWGGRRQNYLSFMNAQTARDAAFHFKTGWERPAAQYNSAAIGYLDEVDNALGDYSDAVINQDLSSYFQQQEPASILGSAPWNKKVFDAVMQNGGWSSPAWDNDGTTSVGNITAEQALADVEADKAGIQPAEQQALMDNVMGLKALMESRRSNDDERGISFGRSTETPAMEEPVVASPYITMRGLGGRLYQNGGRKNTERERYEQWRDRLPRNLQAETDDYDLFGAFRAGLEPVYNEQDGAYHLGSRDPKTGRILKRATHPTFLKALVDEELEGYYPRYQDGEFYTDQAPWRKKQFGDGSFLDDVISRFKSALGVGEEKSMVKKKRAPRYYKAVDGKVFNTWEEAFNHNNVLVELEKVPIDRQKGRAIRRKPNTSPTSDRSTELENNSYYDFKANLDSVNHRTDPFVIPYGDRTITIRKKGSPLKQEVSVNALDSLAKYSGITGTPIQTALGLSDQETGFGKYPLYNMDEPPMGYTERDIANQNYFKNFGEIPAEYLVRDFRYNGEQVGKMEHRETPIPLSMPPLQHAFEYFNAGDYNRGDKNHTRDVLKRGEEVWNETTGSLKEWWETEGRDWYNGKKK